MLKESKTNSRKIRDYIQTKIQQCYNVIGRLCRVFILLLLLYVWFYCYVVYGPTLYIILCTSALYRVFRLTACLMYEHCLFTHSCIVRYTLLYFINTHIDTHLLYIYTW